MRFTPSSLVFLALTAGVFTANLVASFSSSVPSPVAGRLQPANLVHLGTFQVPTGIHSGGQADAGFEYGGTALAFDATRNGLYMTGHDWDQFTGEISIPGLSGTATLLQPLVDATEGKLSRINPTDPNSKKIGGALVYDGKLIVSAYSYYDGNGSQVLSHFTRPLSLGATGQVVGPVRVGPLGAGFYSGYMGVVPAAWQGAFGGPALTGNADLGVITRTSFGPAIFAFDPANPSLGGAQPLVYYPEAHRTLGPWNAASPYFGGADKLRGVVFPTGTSTVLFFGLHGTTFCYGVGTSNPRLAGQPSGNGVDPYCYDPASGSKGVHGYPYEAAVWAYDANDLAAVHAGAKQAWAVVPYGIWPLTDLDDSSVGGAAYDPVTRRIYVSEMFGDGDNPLIHVYTIQ